MGRKQGWEDSSSGPDWVDVSTMMKAMSALHSGHVGLTVLPAGLGSSSGLSVSAAIMFDLLPGSALPPCVAVEAKWPASEAKTFAGFCFSLLHKLDFEVSRVYKQESLWN
jgi:hypothetical protein